MGEKFDYLVLNAQIKYVVLMCGHCSAGGPKNPPLRPRRVSHAQKDRIEPARDLNKKIIK
jgi:hypothetical protein